jgi:ABC-type sugar transport system ATPase subunit
MRDGRHVLTQPIEELTIQSIIRAMVGRDMDALFPKVPSEPGRVVLKVERLTREGVFTDVSFDVRGGEIVALTGLVGSGRTETARLLFGADRPDAGTIELDGRPIAPRDPRDAIRAGVCLLTEDRKAQGLVLGQSVRENFALPNLPRLSRLGFVRRRAERARLQHYVSALRIRLPGGEEPVRNLSGGNQQKVVLAKWLQANCEVVLFDEPTRGIDVGAKVEIYQLMNELAGQGKAILMISSELPEVLGMADRVLVMHEGRLTGEITDVKNATQEQIMRLAVQ